jgi:hypothetical protein
MTTPYATLVNAFQSLQGASAIFDRQDDDYLDNLPEFFDANRSHLDRARAALSQKPTVPLEYQADWTARSADFGPALRHLACIFGAELRLAAHRLDFARAAEIAINGLDLGNAIRRGGLVLDALFSMACTTYLLRLLAEIRGLFAEANRRHLIGELTRIDAERESLESIEARERHWEKVVRSQNPEDCDIDRLIDALESIGEIFAEERSRGIATDRLRAEMREHFRFGKAEKRRGASTEELLALMKEVYEAEKNSGSAEAASLRLCRSNWVDFALHEC